MKESIKNRLVDLMVESSAARKALTRGIAARKAGVSSPKPYNASPASIGLKHWPKKGKNQGKPFDHPTGNADMQKTLAKKQDTPDYKTTPMGGNLRDRLNRRKAVGEFGDDAIRFGTNKNNTDSAFKNSSVGAIQGRQDTARKSLAAQKAQKAQAESDRITKDAEKSAADAAAKKKSEEDKAAKRKEREDANNNMKAYNSTLRNPHRSGKKLGDKFAVDTNINAPKAQF